MLPAISAPWRSERRNSRVRMARKPDTGPGSRLLPLPCGRGFGGGGSADRHCPLPRTPSRRGGGVLGASAPDVIANSVGATSGSGRCVAATTIPPPARCAASMAPKRSTAGASSPSVGSSSSQTAARRQRQPRQCQPPPLARRQHARRQVGQCLQPDRRQGPPRHRLRPARAANRKFSRAVSASLTAS